MILRDSTDPFAIPLQGLDAVAGYADGLYRWSSVGWARFPTSIVPLSIVVFAGDAGDVLDVERFDATPADCPGWADRFDRPGRRRPTIYCDRSTINAVRQAMAGRPFDWWAATLDGTKDVPGAVAVQYAGAAMTGGDYDESVVLDPGWLNLSPAPPLPPPASPPTSSPQEVPMSVTFDPGATDRFAAGLYSGRPGGYYPRQVFVALATDESAVPITGANPQQITHLRVYFVSANFITNGLVQTTDVTLTGSQQATVACGLAGEVFVRVQCLDGGPFFGRAYEEFLPMPS